MISSRLKRCFSVICFMVLGQMVSVVVGQPAEVGTVLRVNNDAIASGSIISALATELETMAGKYSREKYLQNSQVIIQKEVMSTIYELLIYQKAQRELDNMANAEQILASALEKERKKILAEYGGVEVVAEAALEKQGTTLDEKMMKVRRDMIVSSYRQARFDPQQPISHSEMLNYYQKNYEKEFKVTPSMEFRLIDIQAKRFLPEGVSWETAAKGQCQTAEKQARELAHSLYDRLVEGEDFAELAEQYSHGIQQRLGGLWKPRNPNDFTAAYEPVIAALTKCEPGALTPVVAGENRFFIGKLIRYQKASDISFEQAQHDIAEAIRMQRWQKFSRKLSRELLQKAAIGDVEKFITDTAEVSYERFRPESH